MSTVATRRRAPGSGEVRTADLSIGGMTCASCAAKIERRLSRLGEVAATRNFATQTRSVRFPAGMDAADLVAAVEHAGYTATLAAAADGTQAFAAPADGAQAAEEERTAAEMARLRRRLLVSLALAVPVVALAMVPAWQFQGWQWFSLALASPVATWGAWPFHRAAVRAARHRAATMDTLISVGVGDAYLWSVYVLVSGRPGATYLEVAAGVTALVLLGRYLEARAKRRSGAALRALLSLGARDAVVLRGGAEVR